MTDSPHKKRANEKHKKREKKKDKTKSKPKATDPNVSVRLHITPLTAQTAPRLLASVSPDALQTISYHTLPAFPEQPYAFVTVDNDTAEKLKKKWHGALFQGVKLKVEEAKGTIKFTGEPVDGAEKNLPAGSKERIGKEPKLPHENSKKKARGLEGIYAGVEIAPRKVARGWGTKGECLFRTKIVEALADDKVKSKIKIKKSKSGKITITKKEFEKTERIPSFLKGSGVGKGTVSEYIDGVGWVDKDGKVVEEERPRKRVKLEAVEAVSDQTDGGVRGSDGKAETTPGENESEEESVNGDSSSDESSEEEGSDREAQPKSPISPDKKGIQRDGSPDTVAEHTSEQDSDEEMASAVEEKEFGSSDSDGGSSDEAPEDDGGNEQLQESNGAAPGASTEEAPDTARSPSQSPEPATPHPLEVLFKPTAATSESAPSKLFSFGASPSASPSRSPSPTPAVKAVEYTHTPAYDEPAQAYAPIPSDQPLLFSHSSDPYLHSQSIWASIELPKTLRVRVADEVAEKAEARAERLKRSEEKGWKGKKEKEKAEKMRKLEMELNGGSKEDDKAEGEGYNNGYEEENGWGEEGGWENENYGGGEEASATGKGKKRKFDEDVVEEEVKEQEGIWRERFFHFRGEWNRAWKKRRRHEVARVRKREGRQIGTRTVGVVS